MAAAGGTRKRPGMDKMAPDDSPKPSGGAMAETRRDLLDERGPTDADHVAMTPVDDVLMTVKKRLFAIIRRITPVP